MVDAEKISVLRVGSISLCITIHERLLLDSCLVTYSHDPSYGFLSRSKNDCEKYETSWYPRGTMYISIACAWRTTLHEVLKSTGHIIALIYKTPR